MALAFLLRQTTRSSLTASCCSVVPQIILGDRLTLSTSAAPPPSNRQLIYACLYSATNPHTELLLRSHCHGVASTSHHIRSYKSSSSSSNRKGQQQSDESDSDSDNEHRERGESEFWRRKMRTFHGILDVNQDGVISYDDYKLLAEKFTSLGNLNPKASKEFKDLMEKLWEEQWGEITPYNLVTVEKYLSEMHHVLNDRTLKKKAHRFLPYLFQAVDNDNSGFISITEFKLFFKCLGLNDHDATHSFAMIDKNGDGRLSIKEFVKLGRDFFVTEDERRVSKLFWGPLIK